MYVGTVLESGMRKEPMKLRNVDPTLLTTNSNYMKFKEMKEKSRRFLLWFQLSNSIYWRLEKTLPSFSALFPHLNRWELEIDSIERILEWIERLLHVGPTYMLISKNDILSTLAF